MMVRVLVGVVCVMVVGAGCGGSDSDEEARPAAPAVTVTETVEPESSCVPPDAALGILLADSWESVVASRGAADHAERAEEFADDAKELAEDFEDGDCEGEPGMLAAAELAYEASVVNASARLRTDRGYNRVPPVGNKLLGLMGASGQFATP